jgi:transcriptional regulator with XRE-family HTH domain
MASITKRRRFRNIAGPSIRRFRISRGWTQAELAAKAQIAGLDLDRADIGKIECQLRSLYDFELFLLASVLEVPASDLHPGLRRTKGDLFLLRRGYK